MCTTSFFHHSLAIPSKLSGLKVTGKNRMQNAKCKVNSTCKNKENVLAKPLWRAMCMITDQYPWDMLSSIAAVIGNANATDEREIYSKQLALYT